jgi:pSer/pThr/pTyr-binding forkhead associated (FHA) protein
MWTSSVYLEVSDQKFDGRRYVFREPRVCVVGPALDCDIQISQTGAYEVSFYHCLFVIDPPRVRVRDLVSRSGTFVNGARIGQGLDDIDLGDMPGTELKNGDEVRIGQTTIRVIVQGAEHGMEASVAGSRQQG